MTLLNLIIVLVLIGVLLGAVNWAPFIDAKIKQIINWVVIIAVILWLIGVFFGGFGAVNQVKVPTYNHGVR